MFKLDSAEAFNYPFRGRNSFLVAVLLIPAAILGILATVFGAVLLSGQLSWNSSHLDLARLIQIVVSAGVVVVLLSIVPGLLLAGFVIRAMRAVGRGVSGALPGWESPSSLLVTGFGSMVVALVVGLVPLAVFSGGLVTLLQVLFVEQQQQGAFGNFLTSGSAVIFILVFLVSLVCAALVMPMATLRYAMHGSVLAGLNPMGIVQDILRAPVDYAMCLLFPMALSMVANTVMTFLPPLFLLSLPFQVYCQLFGANLLGQYWRLHVADRP